MHVAMEKPKVKAKFKRGYEMTFGSKVANCWHGSASKVEVLFWHDHVTSALSFSMFLGKNPLEPCPQNLDWTNNQQKLWLSEFAASDFHASRGHVFFWRGELQERLKCSTLVEQTHETDLQNRPGIFVFLPEGRELCTTPFVSRGPLGAVSGPPGLERPMEEEEGPCGRRAFRISTGWISGANLRDSKREVTERPT